MKKKVCAHGICIEVFDKKPDMKYDVVHQPDGEMIVSKKKKSTWKEHSVLEGNVAIGLYRRKFFMECSIWRLEDYCRQWRDGLDRLDMYDQSCLVMNVDYARGMNSIEWWLLYKINNKIHIQYDIFLGSKYKKIIDDKLFIPDTCYDFIPKRRTNDDDGEEIQEIIVDMH